MINLDKYNDLCKLCIFALHDAMVAGGVKLGLSEDLAKKLSIATIYGSGHMLFYYDKSAQELRKDVTSPNGTTAAAMDILEIELPLLVDRVFNNDQ